MKSVFGFRVRLQNPKSGFQNLKVDFPIERNHNFNGLFELLSLSFKDHKVHFPKIKESLFEAN